MITRTMYPKDFQAGMELTHKYDHTPYVVVNTDQRFFATLFNLKRLKREEWNVNNNDHFKPAVSQPAIFAETFYPEAEVIPSEFKGYYMIRNNGKYICMAIPRNKPYEFIWYPDSQYAYILEEEDVSIVLQYLQAGKLKVN